MKPETDTIHHPARRQGKTLMGAVEVAKKAIQEVRENGWMTPWAIWINGRRVGVITEEDCARHRKLCGRKK